MEETADLPRWFSAKTVYRHILVEDGSPKTVFEERIVLFRAVNFEDAMTKAEDEAAIYCRETGIAKYLGFLDVYELPEDAIDHRAEVYSLMRDSQLDDPTYLTRFYDTGHERTSTQRGI